MTNNVSILEENYQTLNNKEIDEKCKKYKNMVKYGTKDKEKEDFLIKKAYETNLIAYIKTLLSIYKNLPSIIGIVDKIIEKRATTLVPANTVYGDSYSQTISQINKVINLTERKDRLLNLYVIIEKIISSLDPLDRKIAILKFTQKYTSAEIANETNLIERTVFRKINRLLEKISVFMLKQNWDVEFLKSQIGEESWIYDYLQEKTNDNEQDINQELK